MSAGYAFDTNFYIGALRDAGIRSAVSAFHQHGGRAVRLSAIVGQELLAGARTESQERQLENLLDAVAADGDRVILPSWAAFQQTGRVLRVLALREGYTQAAALSNDALIAASCREDNVTLITANAKDFEAIKRHLRGFRYVTDIPAV
jgi:predicted nucleic acid-binding protein